MKANKLSLHTPTTPGVGSKGHFLFFSKSGHVAYQSKVGKKCRPTCKVTLNLHTILTSEVGFKGQILKLCRCKYIYIFFIKLSRERSGSVVECLTRDRRVAGSSLTGVTALWSLSKTHLS